MKLVALRLHYKHYPPKHHLVSRFYGAMLHILNYLCTVRDCFVRHRCQDLSVQAFMFLKLNVRSFRHKCRMGVYRLHFCILCNVEQLTVCTVGYGQLVPSQVTLGFTQYNWDRGVFPGITVAESINLGCLWLSVCFVA